MNYEDMSDWEVTKRVVEIQCAGQLVKYHPQRDSFEPMSTGVMDDSLYITTESGREQKIDCCNNPSDAWGIIELIWGELMKPPYRGHGTTWERLIGEYSCGKLRAAMICFLKMKDAEK